MFRGVIVLFEQTFVLARIFLLISIVGFLPRFFIMINRPTVPIVIGSPTLATSFTLGVENVKKEFIEQLVPAKFEFQIGLITVKNLVCQQEKTNLELLEQQGIKINTIFYVDDELVFVDQMSKGFDGLDMLLIDVPVIGASYDKTINVLFDIMNKSIMYQLPLIVLDRPNMLGAKIEGPLRCISHNGISIKLPMRHGMTVAELAQYYNVYMLQSKVTLHIIPMSDYHRSIDDLLYNAQWCGIDCKQTALEFFICSMLTKIDFFDVALDTPYPYSCIMLPQSITFSEQQWYQLQVVLRECGIESMLYKYFCTEKNQIYSGLRIHVIDSDDFDMLHTMLTILDFFKVIGMKISFQHSFDEYVGTTLIRQYVQGTISKKKLYRLINNDLEFFYRSAFKFFVYHPLPYLM